MPRVPMRTTFAQSETSKNKNTAVQEFLSRQADFESDLGGLRISKDNFEWLVKAKNLNRS